MQSLASHQGQILATQEAYFPMFLTPCAKAALHKSPSLKKIINTLPPSGRVLNLFFGLWNANDTESFVSMAQRQRMAFPRAD